MRTRPATKIGAYDRLDDIEDFDYSKESAGLVPGVSRASDLSLSYSTISVHSSVAVVAPVLSLLTTARVGSIYAVFMQYELAWPLGGNWLYS